MVPQVGSCDPVRLDLHADPIGLRRVRTRERIAAKKRRTVGSRSKTQDHVLSRQGRFEWLTVWALHRQGDDVVGFLIDRRHRERPKSRRSRMRSRCRREASVSASRAGRLAPQQRLERAAPSGRKCLDAQRALQSFARMVGQIEERVDLRDGHSLLRLTHLHDLVAGADLAFLQDAKVETGPAAGGEQCRHPGLVHPDADAIARHARLGDLEQRAADPIAVADAHGIVGQSLDREVLAELSVDEVGPLQLLLPMAIRLDLVDEDGALLAPVPGAVALPVSIQIQPADPTAATHRILPDPGVHGAPLPLDVARKSDVHR